jgi:membrane associated rhomboid family serine protease
MESYLTSLANELTSNIAQAKLYLVPWLIILACLWLINIVNWTLLGSRLNILGIIPRHPFGLLGIIFSPILHQNFTHLLFNTIPLFALGLLLLARGVDVFLHVTIIVTLLGGFLVWLFARRAIHIGASGLVSGYFGYFIATAYFNPSATNYMIGGVVIYYFGSIFLGLFPEEEKVSFESHIMGFLSGILAAFIPIDAWLRIGIDLKSFNFY